MLPKTMKAICFHRFGSPEELVIEDFPVPVPADDEVLIKVRASAFSPADAKARNGWYASMYEHYLPRIPGIEIGGTVAAKGCKVSEFELGDKVIAFHDKQKGGALAEYCAVKAIDCCHAPKNVPLETVAAVPGYALTALQALSEESSVLPGQRVMVIGAAGGVGQLSVQVAKYKGAYVIGCDVEECRQEILDNGADEMIPARTDEFKKFAGNKLDVIISVATLEEEELREYLKVMNKGGYFVSTVPLKNKAYSGPDYDGKRGLMSLCLSQELEAEFGVHCVWMTVRRGGHRLAKAVELLDSGAMHTIINRTITPQEYKQLNYDFEAGKVRGRNLVLIEGHI
ncbi:MAG: NADP-dependent oxidoreductase [Negativicutes bacterium]|nr:NADP-dependent oxidoreductase [Negativicutes bacterium]